jgi:hypothetical protein
MRYEAMARKHYAGHRLLNKAIAAGVAMDNAIKKTYSKGGTTNCHFMMDNFLKYFSDEKLPIR